MTNQTTVIIQPMGSEFLATSFCGGSSRSRRVVKTTEGFSVPGLGIFTSLEDVANAMKS
jgi:hypothetical protein